MIEPDKDTEKKLEEIYKSTQQTGFINVRTLKRKHAVEKIKTIDDLRIKNLDKISPKKLEALQYLLSRLKNHLGYDFGYDRWFKTYDIIELGKALDSLDVKKRKGLFTLRTKNLPLVDTIKQLIYEIKMEMNDIKIEPTYYQSLIQRQMAERDEIVSHERRFELLRRFGRGMADLFSSRTLSFTVQMMFVVYFHTQNQLPIILNSTKEFNFLLIVGLLYFMNKIFWR